jgi:hypothetical protein
MRGGGGTRCYRIADIYTLARHNYRKTDTDIYGYRNTDIGYAIYHVRQGETEDV